MTQLISLGKLRFNYAGVYSGSTEYEANDVVTYGGDLYVYINEVKADGNLPTNATYWTKILEGVSFIGEWDNTVTYKPNEVVQHAGSTWISKVDNNLNNTPIGGANWDLLLQGDADSVMTTRGDIVYRETSAASRLAIGVDGAVFQSNGTIPSWSRTINNADDVKLTGQLYGGTGAPAVETDLGLTNIQAVFKGNVDDFSQFSIYNANAGGDASTDFIAYANNGDNDSGWIDLGITSSGFTAAAFGLTEANDGYLFFSSPAAAVTAKGNLIIATDGNGTENDIIFATGGFTTGQEKMRLVGTAHGSYNAGLNLTNDVSTTNGKFYIGPNAKSLTVDGTTASTQLNGGINSTATTITVDSTTGFNTKGYITINSEVIYYGGKTSTTFTNCNRGYQGTTAASHADNDTVEQVTYVGLTNPTAIYTGNADDFVQFAIKNTNSGASASTDLIAYASDGDNDSGWIDLGITSATYADPAFTVTGPGTGYLFFSAPATTSGTGDLLIGTDHTGSNNDIVFFTNGFDSGNERVRIIGQGVNAGVEIYADTESTSTTTGALRVEGGVGLIGNMYIGGNINIQGTITVGGAGSSVETTTLTVSDPMIIMGNGNAADAIDLGFYGKYTSSGVKHTGLVRDATDGVFKLFTGLATAPTTTVDFTGATYADLIVGDLTVSGADITTSATGTATLFNTNATTLNIGGAATTVGIGAGTGTTTVNNDLNLASGKVLKINNTQVLSGSALGSGITSSSLTSVGTLTGLTSSGAVSITDSTAATSTTTGALKVTGGASIQGDFYVGGTGVFTGGLRVQELIEDVIDAAQSGNAVTLDYANGNIFYQSGSTFTSNFTISVTNAPTTNGRATTITLIVPQGSTGYIPSTLNVNGSAVTIKWIGGSAPTPTSSAGKFDIFTFTLLYRSSTYTAFATSSLNF